MDDLASGFADSEPSSAEPGDGPKAEDAVPAAEKCEEPSAKITAELSTKIDSATKQVPEQSSDDSKGPKGSTYEKLQEEAMQIHITCWLI